MISVFCNILNIRKRKGYNIAISVISTIIIIHNGTPVTIITASIIKFQQLVELNVRRCYQNVGASMAKKCRH